MKIFGSEINLKGAIVLGIVGFCLEKCINLIWRVCIDSTNGIINHFINGIFLNASKITVLYLIFEFYITILCVFFFIIVYIWWTVVFGDRKVNIKKESKTLYDLKVQLSAYFLILIFLLINPFAAHAYAIYLKSKFEADILKITPYTQHETIDVLKSNWICMKCKADYDSIYEKIESIIDENKLKKN